MRFAYAKIGAGNSEFEKYLLQAESKFIPIYFDRSYSNEEDFLCHGGSKKQGQLFFEYGHERDSKYIIINSRGIINVYKPTGPVIFRQISASTEADGWVKLLPVELVVAKPSTEVPAVLAGINANRYYSSGTFREITSPGNIAALQFLLGLQENATGPRSLLEALNLLGSIEMETLVARILDEQGLFVPAHHGGTMQDIDLFAHNDSDHPINVSGLKVGVNSRIAIQIKTRSNFKYKPVGVDFVICTNGIEKEWQLTCQWLLESIKISPITAKCLNPWL